MDKNFNYRVWARCSDGDSIHLVPLFDSYTIDDACAIALGYFRSCNSPFTDILICEFGVDRKEIVVFKHRIEVAR